MAIMIAGGAGFIGSHLVDACVAAGEEVVVFDDLSTGKLANLAGALDSGSATFVYADVAISKGKLAAALARANCGPVTKIFHLASPERGRVHGARTWAALATAGIGTMSLVDFALDLGAQFVMASTPDVEHDEGKRFGEAVVAAAVRERGLDGRVVRFSECYGPRMDLRDERLVPSLLEAARLSVPFVVTETAARVRSLTYVDDVVAGLLGVCDGRFAGDAPVTLASEDHGVEDVARVFVEATGAPLDIACVMDDPKPLARTSNVETLARSANVSLAEGLRRTHVWYATDALAFA